MVHVKADSRHAPQGALEPGPGRDSLKRGLVAIDPNLKFKRSCIFLNAKFIDPATSDLNHSANELIELAIKLFIYK